MTTQLIYQKMAELMARVDAIGKNKYNQGQKFNYRGIDDVYNHIQPIMGELGIFNMPELQEINSERVETKNGGSMNFTKVKVKYSFFAVDGSSVSAITAGEGMDSGDKSTSKAMTSAHKAALLQVLCIPTEDLIDPDSEGSEDLPPVKVELISKQNAEALRRMLKETQTDEIAYIEWLSEKFKVKMQSLEDLPRDGFNVAMNKLIVKQQKQTGANNNG